MAAHSGELYSIACDARERAIKSANGNADVPTSDTITAIVLAAAATEAFINELPELCDMQRPTGRIGEPLLSLIDILNEVEGSRGSVKVKYLWASRILSGQSFRRGSAPYQDFNTLIDLRNDIMHVKPIDLQHKEPPAGDDKTLFVPADASAIIKGLQQRKLARKPAENAPMSWFHSIQTPAMAEWACVAAFEVITAVLGKIPTPVNPVADPTLIFKFQFDRFRTCNEG